LPRTVWLALHSTRIKKRIRQHLSHRVDANS
jgi:hypothetical protein